MSLIDSLKKWAKRDQNPPTEQRPQTAKQEQAPPEQTITPPTEQPSAPPRSPSATWSSIQRPAPATRSPSESQSMPALERSGSNPRVTGNVNTSITLSQLALKNLQDLGYDDDGGSSGPWQIEGPGPQQEQTPSETASQMQPIEPSLSASVAVVSGLEGQTINGLYRIDKLLAQGGMGQVFLASHMGRNEMPVVLKLLIKQADRNSIEYNRFLQEMLISGRMRHPNLIKVFDYGILLDGLKPYLVMEFVEGEPLRAVLRRKGTLNLPDACRIIMQACDGLHEVHEKGVVHRDLKPENLMIRGDYTALDNVKILDFGIAQLQNKTKFDEEGLAVGSVGYMSPEQICAQPVDHRTDIYSLGLILYETLTGHPPFVGGTRRETMAMHVQAKHMPPSSMASIPMGTEVDRIIEKALAKHPDKRYQQVRELQSELVKLIDAL